MLNSLHLDGQCSAELSTTLVCAAFVMDCTPDMYKRVMDVNLMGVVHTLKAALPLMAKQRSGHVVITGSTASFVGAQPMLCSQTASIHALSGTCINMSPCAEVPFLHWKSDAWLVASTCQYTAQQAGQLWWRSHGSQI